MTANIKYRLYLLIAAIFANVISVHGQIIITTISGTGGVGYTGDGSPAVLAKLNFPLGVKVDGSGNVYIADQYNYCVRKIDNSGIITTIAGNGVNGYTGDNGPATLAKIGKPWGVAVDGLGNVYIADQSNRCVRKVNPLGIITTFAGTGVAGYNGDNIPATTAKLTGVVDVATDISGNVYIADAVRVRKVDLSGTITTVAGNGTAGYTGDGTPATSATIGAAGSVSVDIAGNIYIGDQGNFCIRKVNTSGIITTIAGTGIGGYSGDGGPATIAQLQNLVFAAPDAIGNVYISDLFNSRIRKVDPFGIITTIAGTGIQGYNGDGLATASQIQYASGLAVDALGLVYICDENNQRIRKIGIDNSPAFTAGLTASVTVMQNSAMNPVNTQLIMADVDAGQREVWSLVSGPSNGTAAGADTMVSTGGTIIPTRLSYTPTTGYTGRDSFIVRITDGYLSDTIKVYVTVTPLPTGGCGGGGIITTIAGTGTAGSTGDGGPATSAELNDPYSVAADGAGNIYVANASNHTIRKINPAGIITTIAGTGASGSGGDGGPATAAQFMRPTCVTLDGASNLYVADFADNKIRKINASGIITTIAGTGISGYSGDGLAATLAKLKSPVYVAVDGGGNVYVAEAGNHCIRKINTSGIITTVAGVPGPPGFAGDGFAATTAKFNMPDGVAIDGIGNIYISDHYNHRIRKVDVTGIITTIGGTGIGAYSGDNGPATAANLDNPGGIVVTSGGDIIFAAMGNNQRVRKISAAGIITTIAGAGTAGYCCDGGPATTAMINYPHDGPGGLAIDAAGSIYIADVKNYRIRKVTVNNSAPSFTGGHNQTITICPGTVKIDTQLSVMDIDPGQTNTWKIVTPPAHGTAIVTYTATTTGDTIIPMGLSYTPTTGYVGTDVLKVSVEDCGGVADTTTITITVGSVASAGVITGPSAVCLGNTISLTNAVSGGVWSSSNTNVSISSTGVVTGMAAGTATISYSVAGTCGTPVAKGTVTVINMPTPISGPTNVCTGMTIALTDAVGGGFWTSSNTAIATAGAGSGIVFGVKAGTATISYTIGGVCAVNTTINVDPPLPAIKGPGKVCVGDVVTLSDSVTSGTWGTSSSFAFVNPITGDVLGVSKGTGIITYSVSTGCIAVKSFTVNPNPGPITLTSPVMCYSDKGMYASNPDAGGIWTSWLVTVATGGYLTAYHSGSGLITYTLPTGCFTTAPITVNPLPGMITGANKICEGQLSALSDTTYGGTWSTTDATVLVDIYSGGLYGVSPGTAVVTYQLPTTCFVVDTITVYPKPTAILGNLNVCPGNSTLLSDALPGGTWSISAGGYGSIDATTGVATGIMAGGATVTYTSGMGCSATAALTIWPLPSPFTVTGGGHFCAGGTGVHVSLTGSAGGVKYYLFNGSTLVDSMMGIGALLDYGPRTGGMYTVYAVNPLTQCGNIMTGSAMVVEDPILVPAVSINTMPGDTVCEGGTISFVAGVINEGPTPAYQWKVNGIPVGTGLNTYGYMPKDGDLVGIEMTSSEACVAPAKVYSFRTVTVVSPVTPTLTLTADPGVSIPEGATVTFTAKITSKTVAATYQWLKNATPIAGEINATYTATDIKNFDTISCRVWSGGFCSMTAIERLHMNVYKTDGGNNNTGVHGASSNDAMIRVIPNPSKGAFTVTGSLGNITEESVTLELTDMIGRMIYKGAAAVKDGRINTEVELNNAIVSGTYLLNARSGAMHKVFHIIIEQ